MTAPTRWWAAPTGKTELDAVEKAMLAPTGEDRRYDLGGVLLAAHRAGAGACRKAASLPLLDERGLVSALADARQALGVPMAEAVAKCVGGGPEAMLLTRDLLDDADEAALDLFRTAVAKGVPAPTAALRVGDVYGADTRSLGKYRQLALDPKASPVALTDTADRVLFSYIQDVCNNELAETPIVSKATIAQERAREEATRRTYVRDEEGRFAAVGGQGAVARMRQRLGIGATSVPRVSDVRPTEQEQQAPAGPSAREVLAVRQLRRQRAKARREKAQSRTAAETSAAAPETSEAAAETSAQTRSGARARTMARARRPLLSTRLRQQMAAKDAALQAPSRVRANTTKITPDQIRAISESEPTAQLVLGSRFDTGLNEPDTRYPDNYPFVKVPGMVQIVLGEKQAADLITKSLDTPEKIFLLRALRARTNQDPIINNPEAIDPGEGKAAVQEALSVVTRPHPDIFTGDLITKDSLNRKYSQLEEDDQLNMEVNEYLASKGWGPERHGFVERKSAVSVPLAHDADGWYLVDQWSEEEGQAVPYEDQPISYIFNIPAGYAEGENAAAGTRQPADWTLNPNQHLKVRRSPSTSSVLDVELPEWNAKGFWVKTVEVEPVSAERWREVKFEAAFISDEAQQFRQPPQQSTGKALTTQERSQQVATEPRDDAGRWVARGALERLRERMATQQDQKPTTQQVAAVRALRSQRRAARKLRRATAVPAEATQEGAIATQEDTVATARTQARTRTRQRARTISPELIAAIENPKRVEAQQAVNLQRKETKPQKGDLEWRGPRRKAVAVPKGTPHPERRPLILSPFHDHIALDPLGFSWLVGAEPGTDSESLASRDVYRLAPDDNLQRVMRSMADNDVVLRNIRVTHEAGVKVDEPEFDRFEATFADDDESAIRETMKELLSRPGVSVVRAHNMRAFGSEGIDQPDHWEFSYDERLPSDPVYVIRMPSQQDPFDENNIELHRVAGRPAYVEEQHGSVRLGFLQMRSIPVVTYAMVTPAEVLDDNIPPPTDVSLEEQLRVINEHRRRHGREELE